MQQTKEQLGKLFSDGQYQKCFDLAVETLEKDSTDFTAISYKGACLFKLGEYNEAINILSECIDKKSNYSYLWVFRGNCHYVLKDYERAFSDYWFSLRLDPSNGAVVDKCARSLFLLGDIDYALEFMQKAIKLQESPEPFLVMIAMLRQIGHPLWAEEIEKLGMQQFPKETRFEKYLNK